jgi:hypothetical protein
VQRPTGVTILAVLDFLGAGLSVLVAIAGFLGATFLGAIISQAASQSGRAGMGAGLGAVIGAAFGVAALIGCSGVGAPRLGYVVAEGVGTDSADRFCRAWGLRSGAGLTGLANAHPGSRDDVEPGLACRQHLHHLLPGPAPGESRLRATACRRLRASGATSRRSSRIVGIVPSGDRAIEGGSLAHLFLAHRGRRDAGAPKVQ